MEAIVNPTENIEQLKENLEKRVESIVIEEKHLVVELESLETLRLTPGVESFTCNGKTEEGLHGSPVSEPVYAKL
ncbi:MAG: hypothetical protein ABEJ72_08655, partial [Candidatus Aenigmatarchaeota archaeon]